MQDKLWQALYFGYDYAAPFLPQLEKNLHLSLIHISKFRKFKSF